MPRKKVVESKGGEGRRMNRKEIITQIIKPTKTKFLTESQKTFVEIIKDPKNVVVLASGPAGTGKSFLSLKSAIDLLADPLTPYERILIIRSPIEVGPSIGFIKGDLETKLHGYMFPSFYLLEKIIGKEALEQAKEAGIIDTLPLSFVRGLNFENMIVVCEEVQNCSPQEVLTILTRCSFGSKLICSGSEFQSDRYNNPKDTGLEDAMIRLEGAKGVGTFRFQKTDIVRSPILQEIIERYEKK